MDDYFMELAAQMLSNCKTKMSRDEELSTISKLARCLKEFLIMDNRRILSFMLNGHKKNYEEIIQFLNEREESIERPITPENLDKIRELYSIAAFQTTSLERKTS